MPSYDYFCDTNGRTLEVSHSMSLTLKTWGDICDTAHIDVGNTPKEAPLRRIFSTPQIATGNTKDQVTTQVPCQPQGCPCHH